MTLAPGDIHVWQGDLDAQMLRRPHHQDANALLAEAERLMSPDEHTRRRTIRLQKLRDRFALTRLFLRTTLACYVDSSPMEIKFVSRDRGKPVIPGSSIRFSLSHSAGVCLLAVSQARDVGVDVERIDPTVDELKIAARFFSRAEHKALAALPEGDRNRAFFSAWTRKEAFLKGLGHGISGHLDRFAVSVSPSSPPVLERVEWDANVAGQWTLVDLDVGSDCRATLAVEGDKADLRRFDWPDNLPSFLQ
jgi:4'-phosphopantetheinyl transferase